MSDKQSLILYFSSSAITYIKNGSMQVMPLKDQGNASITDTLEEILEAHQKEFNAVQCILSPSFITLSQLSLPVMKKGDLIKVLERKVSVMQGFEEGKNWGYQLLGREEKIDTMLLYVVAHSLVEAIISVCEPRGILIHSILPLPVLPLLVEQAEVGDGQVLLILLSRSVLVRVHKEGKTLFTREFSCKISSDDPAEAVRLQKEVERTLLYVKQQYQIFSPTLHYVGDENPKMEEAISELSYVGHIRGWIRDALSKLEHAHIESCNILPKSYIEERKRVKQFYLVIVLLTTAFLFALASYLYIVKNAKEEKAAIAQLRVDESIDSLQQRLTSLQSLEQKIVKSQNVVTYLEKQKHDPIGGWTIAYISKIIPSRLILSRFDMEFKHGFWECRIEGFAPRSSIEAANLLKEFEKNIASEPISMKVDQAWIEQWKENLHVGDTREKELINKRFYIEGRIF